ncbi:MAG TPA: nuclear transport factor 2 family protein [Puia sp.]|nr:nuclear transport factor 2 family protein [Puia sp.]
MKINALLSIVAIFCLLMSCTQSKSTDNPEVLKKVLTSYFEGIENKDFDKLKSLTTDDFILYEDGRVWNNDSGFANIRRHMPFTVKYKLDNFKINVDNMSGDMTYYNHADFIFSDSSKASIDWIESATFRKMNRTWKINFLQLTERK